MLVDLHPASTAEARGVVRAELAGRCAPGKIDDALLAVSELLNNAIIHAQTEPRVAAYGSRDRLRVEVWDADPRPPVLGPAPHPHADTGRGLHLVNAVAEAWGYEFRDRGKVVWFELNLVDDSADAAN